MTTPSPSAALPAGNASTERLNRRAGAIVFLVFAAAYFCSTLVRAITATLSPVLTQEFSLHSRDLGLLAGGYFLGFAAIQLPLGKLLDMHGPKRVSIGFLVLAVFGCLAFSVATSFVWLLAARVLMGMGLGVCLMAPLTGFRRWFDPATQLRVNSWMLMTGSLGMLSSTLPVQWLVPVIGWRPLFWILATLVLLSTAVIVWVTPGWPAAPGPAREPGVADPGPPVSYADVWRNPFFRKLLPLAFFNYAGMVTMQTLWAGPWMIRVAGYTPLAAATGLFYINACMLLTFLFWGFFNPRLAGNGWSAERLITWLAPVSILVLAFNIWGGAATGWGGWAMFCVTSSVMALAQPAVGMAFGAALAGRALAAYNLGIMAGIFVLQWGIGLMIDLFARLGLGLAGSFQGALSVFLCCCIASYAYFLSVKVDNPSQ